MRYTFDKARDMLRLGYVLSIVYVARTTRARILDRHGSVLGTLSRTTRDRVLDEVPLVVRERRPRATVWVYDYAFDEVANKHRKELGL